MAPDMLRSAPVLTQLRELRLSQLQVGAGREGGREGGRPGTSSRPGGPWPLMRREGGERPGLSLPAGCLQGLLLATRC